MRCITLLFLIVCHGVFAQKGNIEKVGDVLQIALPALTSVSTLINQDGHHNTWEFTNSYGTTMAITYGLKYRINAKRPNGRNYSFPSGYTASVFSGASFIQRWYGWIYGALTYVLAGYVGWSRIEANKHYTLDVVAGAALGILSAYLFTKNSNKKDKKLRVKVLETEEQLVTLLYTF